MPPLKETRLQIEERNRREIRNRTNKRLAELAQEAERKRQGTSSTQQEDEIEDEDEDMIEDKMEDMREDKIKGQSGLCAWRLCRVCQCLVLGVLFVIMSVFVLSVGWHVCSKSAA